MYEYIAQASRLRPVPSSRTMLPCHESDLGFFPISPSLLRSMLGLTCQRLALDELWFLEKEILLR